MYRLLLPTIVLLIPLLTTAEELIPTEKPDQGYWWYEKEPAPKSEKKQEPYKSDSTTSKESKDKNPMSVSWVREMLPKLQERAIDNPTRENLSAYLYLQRVMLDKSQRFSEEAKKVAMIDPMLDESNRIPSAGFAKNEFLDKEFNAKADAMKYLAKNVGGLFVFFDSKCDFCKSQVKVINMLKSSYGFNVKYISMDNKGLPGIDEWEPDNGHAKMLDLKIYPTTVFAVPPKTYLIVSQGMMSKDQLIDRILLASTSSKLLPKEMEKNVNPWDRGVLTVEDMQDGATTDPDKFVKYVKEKLKETY